MLALSKPTQLEAEIEHVQYLLKEWCRWERGWKPALGAPGCSPIVRLPMKPAVSLGNVDDALEEPYVHSEEVEDRILNAVAASVDDLQPIKRSAVRVIYLRETLAAVFRSNRITMSDAARLCAEAEIDLIPLLRNRAVVVAGI